MLAESLGMRDRGHEVWIATPPEGELARRASTEGLPVIPMSFARALLPVNARSLSSVVRGLRPDVVNSHSSADSWTAALARRVGTRPGALIRSRHISARVKPGPLHRFLYHQADFVITTGESVRGELASSGLVPLERSASIPTGVDLDRFRPRPGERMAARQSLGVRGDGPVLGVVAYLRPDKGHTVLLDAMPELLRSHPTCVLAFVGDGPTRADLEARAAQLGIGSSIRFAGLREDVPHALAAFDVFCLPSVRNEGVPQSLIQAAASGLPTVSTAVGGIPEVIVDGVTGFIVSPSDPVGLAGAVGRLLGDAGLRSRFGDAGRRHAAARFSVERMLDLTEQAYGAALQLARAKTRPGHAGSRAE